MLHYESVEDALEKGEPLPQFGLSPVICTGSYCTAMRIANNIEVDGVCITRTPADP